MPVETRFRVTSEHRNAHSPEAKTLELYGVQSKPFGEATPAANIHMTVVNPDAAKEFELGATYKVTFEKVED